MSTSEQIKNMGAYWVLNKCLTRALGANTAVTLMEIVYIWEHNKNNKANPGWAYKKRSILAEQVGVSVNTVKRCVQTLKNHNLITVKSGHNNSNYYRVESDNIFHFGKNQMSQNEPTESNQMSQNEPTIKESKLKEKESKEKEPTVLRRADKPTLPEQPSNIDKTKRKRRTLNTKKSTLNTKNETLNTIKQNIDRKKRNIDNTKNESKRSKLKRANTKPLNESTIDILDWWNEHPTLTAHRLSYTDKTKKYIAPLSQQSATIQKIDCLINKVYAGTFFNIYDEIPDRFKNHRFTVEDIGTAISRIALAYDNKKHSFGNKSKPSLTWFFYNQNSKMLKGENNKFKLRFPFLHWLSNEPSTIWDRQTKVTPTHPRAVDNMVRILEKKSRVLTGKKHTLTDREYNTVVSGIDKAVDNVKAAKPSVVNRSFIMQVPTYIKETLESKGIPVDLEHFGLGIHCLIPELSKRLVI